MSAFRRGRRATTTTFLPRCAAPTAAFPLLATSFPKSKVNRGFYDSYSPQVDIQSVSEKAAWNTAMSTPGGIHGALPVHRALKPATHRYDNAGNVSSWAGGVFDPAEGQRELAAFNRPGLGRVYTAIAVHDRSAPPAPFAERLEAVGPHT